MSYNLFLEAVKGNRVIPYCLKQTLTYETKEMLAQKDPIEAYIAKYGEGRAIRKWIKEFKELGFEIKFGGW